MFTQWNPLGFMRIAFPCLHFLISGIIDHVGYIQMDEVLCASDPLLTRIIHHWRHLYLVLSESGCVGEHVPREEVPAFSPSILGRSSATVF